MSLLVTPKDVLDYWFANTRFGKLDVVQDRMKPWFFRSSPDFDAIQFENTALLASLKAGTCSWDLEHDAEATIAAVVVLDQFSRAIYRGTADAFAADELAAGLVQKAVTKGWFTTYSPIERLFLVVSFQHSEQMPLQELGLQLAPLVGQCDDPAITEYFANLKGFPMEHYDVMKRFGRFPHRNGLLGRQSTAEEVEWMESPDCPGWAKSQQAAK